MKNALTNPAYIRNDGQSVVTKNLINISNKTQLANYTATSTGEVIQKYVIPATNLDSTSSNDVNLINFKKDDTRNIKKIEIPSEYTEGNSNENYNISGNLLISKDDSTSMLNRNSGIYMIANYYNKQVDNYYQNYGNSNNDNANATEAENFIKDINDVVVLYNTNTYSDDGTELSDYLNVSKFGEIFIPTSSFNISLNKNNQRIFDYQEDKEKYITQMNGSDSSEISKVYIYYDYNNKQLNKNIYNTDELAKQEAYSNVVIRPSQEKILLLNEGVKASDSNTNYVNQGIVISKNTSMLTWIDLTNLADSYNGWSTTPVYFTNYTNAFNYMRYLFEMSYTAQ